MVQFNELRVLPNGCKLIIDASVKDLSYYTDVYIDSIIIDNQDTFVNTGPSSNPIYTYTVPADVEVYAEENTNDATTTEGGDTVLIETGTDTKSVYLSLDILDFANKIDSFENEMLFVYVVTKGIPSSDTPCGMDNQTTLGVVYNEQKLYDLSIYYLRELNKCCQMPKGFIDALLRMKALELAVKTGHYIQAVKYWKLFFTKRRESTLTSCGCNG